MQNKCLFIVTYLLLLLLFMNLKKEIFLHRVSSVVQTVCLSKNLAQWYHNLCITLKIILFQSLCDILSFFKKEQIYVICICMILYFYTAFMCKFNVVNNAYTIFLSC